MSASLEQLLRDARIDLVLSRIEKNESVISEVIQSVESDIRSVKFNSILVLGEIGEKSGGRAIPIITRCLKDDDWSIRREAARTLGKIGRLSETAIIDLSSLIGDEESTIRLAIVSSLGKIGIVSPDSISTLKKGLKDKDELVRAEAAIAIGLLGVEAFDLIPDLMNGLKDPNWIVRTSSAQSISSIGKGTIKAIPALIQALGDDDWRVRNRVITTLVQIGEPSIEHLMNVLHHNKRIVRKGAAEALGEIKKSDQKIIESLGFLLSDEREEVRGIVADALRNIGPTSIQALILGFGRSVNLVKLIWRLITSYVLWICYLFFILISPIFIHGIFGILNFFYPVLDLALLIYIIYAINRYFKENTNRKIMIISAISGIGESAVEAIPFVFSLFAKRNKYIRVEAARALGKIGLNSSEAIEGLSQLLRDPKTIVRREAALSLGKIGIKAESAVDDLLYLLNDKKPEVRWRATEALGKIGINNPKILTGLQTMIKDECDYVCESADNAIDKITEGN